MRVVESLVGDETRKIWFIDGLGLSKEKRGKSYEENMQE
jgi:hypothetical protein